MQPFCCLCGSWLAFVSRQPTSGLTVGRDKEAGMPAKNPRTTKAELDERLDRALQDTFPASDPVSFVEPGPAAPRDKAPAGKERPGKAKRKAARS